jgi:hypothetical protein
VLDAVVRSHATRTPHLARLLVRRWPRHRRNAPPGLRSPTYSVRRARPAATFYTTGMEHSPTSPTGTAWERTPCHAAQRAAWEGDASRRTNVHDHRRRPVAPTYETLVAENAHWQMLLAEDFVWERPSQRAAPPRYTRGRRLPCGTGGLRQCQAEWKCREESSSGPSARP